jgi:large subunit ribosomal protein L24
MFKIKRDDLVEVMKGRDRGKRGKVRNILTKEHRAVVADVNVMKKHVKPGTRAAAQAGIIDLEMPIQLANLALVCNECSKPTRVAIRVLNDGSKARVCKKCGQLT